MKNKLTFCIATVLLVLTFCLVACSGRDIDFKVENVDVPLNNECVSSVANLQMVNKISNTDEMKAFFNNDYFGKNTADKFTMFDSKYFENNSLLVICFPKGKNEYFNITKLKQKGDELFVIMDCKRVAGDSWIYCYKFLTVAKESVAKISKLSYVINTFK